MKPTITAYCWASGLIEFGNTLPEGALPIVTGIAAICLFRVFPKQPVRMKHARRWKDFLA